MKGIIEIYNKAKEDALKEKDGNCNHIYHLRIKLSEEIAEDKDNLLYYKAAVKKLNIEWNTLYLTIVATLLSVMNVIDMFTVEKKSLPGVVLIIILFLILIITVGIMLYCIRCSKNYELYNDVGVVLEEIQAHLELNEKQNKEGYKIYNVKMKKVE